MDERSRELMARGLEGDGRIVCVTGAGISAESGIPTFRGAEGYWTVGSKNWHPQELATNAAFQRMPNELWGWYLFRRGVCRAAEPNAAHTALARVEQALGDRFVLVTQNVDGLHLRAGSSPERTWQIHGCIDFMRCADECGADPVPLPAALPHAWKKGRVPNEDERRLLVCNECSAAARPHVLWFDETYDERFFRWDSSIAAAREASLLIVIGTSGATNLPLQIASIAARRRLPMVVVNREESPFSELAGMNPSGVFLQGTAGALVPGLAEVLSKGFCPEVGTPP